MQNWWAIYDLNRSLFHIIVAFQYWLSLKVSDDKISVKNLSGVCAGRTKIFGGGDKIFFGVSAARVSVQEKKSVAPNNKKIGKTEKFK